MDRLYMLDPPSRFQSIRVALQFRPDSWDAEIGVRKVIGASEASVIWLLSRETALLVGIAVVLALPAVWYFGAGWLESFACSSGIRPLTLILGAVAVFALAFVTTGTQALRASRLNPAQAIRTD